LIRDKFSSFGYNTDLVGSYANVFAYSDACKGKPVTLLCAHYDSVPNCPAADDNASAVTGLITLGEIISNHFRHLPIAFVAVNREEDGLLGSQQFAKMIVKNKSFDIAEVHNLEMIGFCSSEKGSQHLPQGLVIPGVDTGDFLALIGNDACEDAVRRVLVAGRTYVPELPILALQVDQEFAQVHSDLLRSDHASFWEQGINAVQYTDTANFRNPHYHEKTDTPETLDYGFHSRVVMTVLATIVERARLFSEG
jgi:Zn-dependent M28 family amino/carboxypeptidase